MNKNKIFYNFAAQKTSNKEKLLKIKQLHNEKVFYPFGYCFNSNL